MSEGTVHLNQSYALLKAHLYKKPFLVLNLIPVNINFNRIDA